MANESKKEKSIKADVNTSLLDSTNLRRHKDRKKGKKLFVVFIILLILGVIGFLFKTQINNFLSKNLKSVPVVNQIFKETSDPYSHLNKEAIIQELEAKKREQEFFNQTIIDLKEENVELQQKINGLKEYETKYEEFINQKEAWDEEVAKTDSKLFIEQFEKMYPDTMERIYRDLKIDTMIAKEQREFSNTVGQMDADQAARALETLIPTDPDLIKVVFDAMEQERKSKILSNMQANSAAIVIKLLSPNIAQANE